MPEYVKNKLALFMAHIFGVGAVEVYVRVWHARCVSEV